MTRLAGGLWPPFLPTLPSCRPRKAPRGLPPSVRGGSRSPSVNSPPPASPPARCSDDQGPPVGSDARETTLLLLAHALAHAYRDPRLEREHLLTVQQGLT